MTKDQRWRVIRFVELPVPQVCRLDKETNVLEVDNQIWGGLPTWQQQRVIFTQESLTLATLDKLLNEPISYA